MIQNYLWELQKTIFFVLNTNQRILNIVTGIYSYVPQNTSFPYIKIREINSNKISVTGKEINKVILFIEIYSSNKSNEEVLSICSEIRGVLDKNIYEIEGYKMLDSNLEYENIKQGNNSDIWKGEMKFFIFVEKELTI